MLLAETSVVNVIKKIEVTFFANDRIFHNEIIGNIDKYKVKGIGLAEHY